MIKTKVVNTETLKKKKNEHKTKQMNVPLFSPSSPPPCRASLEPLKNSIFSHFVALNPPKIRNNCWLLWTGRPKRSNTSDFFFFQLNPVHGALGLVLTPLTCAPHQILYARQTVKDYWRQVPEDTVYPSHS